MNFATADFVLDQPSDRNRVAKELRGRDRS
jgi:hypothetical protein